MLYYLMMSEAQSLQQEALLDLANMYGVTLEEPSGETGLRLYFVIDIATKVAMSNCVEFGRKPHTKIGALTAELREAVAQSQASRGGMGSGCWESELQFMRSINHLTKGRSSRREALVFLDNYETPVAFEKHKGAQTTLILQRHPYFGNVPPGTIVDDYHPSRITDVKSTSNPYLLTTRVPEAAHDLPAVIRPSLLNFTKDELTGWGYDPKKVLIEDGREGLVPYLKQMHEASIDDISKQVLGLVEALK